MWKQYYFTTVIPPFTIKWISSNMKHFCFLWPCWWTRWTQWNENESGANLKLTEYSKIYYIIIWVESELHQNRFKIPRNNIYNWHNNVWRYKDTNISVHANPLKTESYSNIHKVICLLAKITISDEETFLQDFHEILKRTLPNF